MKGFETQDHVHRNQAREIERETRIKNKCTTHEHFSTLWVLTSQLRSMAQEGQSGCNIKKEQTWC